jgi:hypothetical protein
MRAKSYRLTAFAHTSHVLDALLDRLIVKPDLYLNEMAEFVWNKFGLSVSTDCVRRSLKVYDWSKKKTQRVACKRDFDLRDACLRELPGYQSEGNDCTVLDSRAVPHSLALSANRTR